MEVNLQDLSVELLIKIFEYCHFRELHNLQKTCRQFYEIIASATSLGNSTPLLVTNHLRPEMRNRCYRLLGLNNKNRISYHWKNGVYQEKYMLKSKKKVIPWLVLTKDKLWISRGNELHSYARNQHNLDIQDSFRITLNTADICKFVLKQNYIVSGQQDSSILIWKSTSDYVYWKDCHDAEIHSVDLEENLIVSGAKDGSIKVWPLDSKDEQPTSLYCHTLNDRVWSTAFSERGQHVAIGTAGYNSVPPLHIFDLQKGTILQQLGQNFRKGSGILQIKWESPFTLLSCGYDKNVRKWDTRTGRCEQQWEDPFYSTIYCFDTDNYCTLLTGTASHGRVVLWDMRLKNYTQMYFMESCRKVSSSSPVYSLSFDASHLFGATDRYLNALDFSRSDGRIRNYSNMFRSTTEFYA